MANDATQPAHSRGPLPPRPATPMTPPAPGDAPPGAAPPAQPLRPAHFDPQARAAAASATPTVPPMQSGRPARPAQPMPRPVPASGGINAFATPPGATASGTRGHSWLRVDGLRHSYQDAQFTLIVGHLEFYPGELTYIGGESGSGKSTLIKILATAQEPAAGEIWIYDRQVSALSPREREDLRGEGITYIPQGHLGLLDQTPVANIQRFLHDYDGLDWPAATSAAEQALDRSGLPRHCFEKSIKQLSGGEQARVAIARAEATGRPICLTDEILPALDATSRKAIVRLFQQLASRGFTVVIIAHQPELKEYFHRVIEMSHGQIVGDSFNPTPQWLP